MWLIVLFVSLLTFLFLLFLCPSLTLQNKDPLRFQAVGDRTRV